MTTHLPDGTTANHADDWKAAHKNENHWRKGYSAHATAHAWQPPPAFPPPVLAALRAAPPLFADIKPIKGYVERATKMPAGGYPSMTDLIVFAQSGGDAVIIAVEGKSNERFGDHAVEEWSKATKGTDDNANRKKRLAGILEIIGLNESDTLQTVRYQLLHRMAAAVVGSRGSRSDTRGSARAFVRYEHRGEARQ